MLRRILAALAIVLLTTAPAEAAPVAGLVAALSSWWAGAGLAVKLLIGLAVKVGVGLLEQYRARKAAGNQQRGVSLQVQMGDTLPRVYIIGTRATAGVRKYIGSWGSAGKTPNAYLVDVRELSCLPSRAGPTGLQSVRIGDKYVTVLWDQPHADGRGYPVQEYRANGNDYLWIKYLDGTQTAADPYLLDKFGAHETRPWKATMIGRGCQAVIMTMRRNDTLYKQGLPAALFVPKPMPLYDVRKDSTVGGSGAHRWDDPATWEASDNLPQMMYNLARGIHYGGRWVHGGRNFATHRLPASAWMAALNEADRNMGEGRKQFRGGLEVSVDATGLDTLDKMRLGCAGRLSENGGILKLLVGAPAAAVFAITDESVLVTREQDFQPFPSISEVSNTIRATYPEPAQGWTSKDAPVRTTAALLARDDGRELAVDVDFDVVSDSAQVQCLTATMIEEAQRWRVHQFVLPPAARVLEPGFDVVSYTSEFNSYGNKKFIVERIARLQGCLWQIVLRELEPADYDPPTIILPPVVGPTGPIDTPDQVTGGFTAVKSSIDDGVGAPRRPAIRVGVEPDLDDVVGVRIQIRVKQTGALVFDNTGSTPYPEPFTGGVYSWLLAGTWCVPAGTYLVRGRLIPGSRRRTLWSGDIEVTVDNLGIATDDILDGAIKELKLADRAVSDLKIKLLAIKTELIENSALIASKIADAAITTTKFANGIEPVSIVPGTTVPTTKTTTVIMVNGKLYRWNGTAYKAEIDAADIAGTLKDAQVESINASKILGTLISSQIADAAITAAKFANGIRPVEIVSTLPGAPHVQGRVVILTTDSKLYRNSGSGWVASVAAADISGQVQAAQIAALEAVKLTGQISGVQISDDAISSPKIAAGAIIAGKMAVGAVLAIAIAAGAVTTSKLDALAVTADKLAADSVIAGKVAAGAINAREIAAGAVTASKLFVGDTSNIYPDFDFADDDFYGGNAGVVYNITGTGTSYNSKRQLGIAPHATVNQQVSCGTFTLNQNSEYWVEGVARAGNAMLIINLYSTDASGAMVYTRSVTLFTDPVSGKQSSSFETASNETKGRIVFRNGAGATDTAYFSALVIRRKAMGALIVDGEIIAIKIAVGAVTTAKIAVGAVVASTIASGAVTTAKLDALAVTAEKLAADSVIAGKVAAGAINAREIAAGAISASKMFVGDTSNIFPDFDLLDDDFFTGLNGTSFSIGRTGISYNGSRQLAITSFGAASQNVATGWFTVNQSSDYYFEGVARNGGTGGDPQTIIQCATVDASGVIAVTTSTSVTTTSVNGKQSSSFTTASNETKARILYRNRAGATGTAYFSAPIIRRKAMGELIVDGAIIALKLATDSVTTAKILAGAITAVELGAGAVTAIKIAAGAVTADKMNVSSLAAISASFGNAIFTGYAASANGKLKLDFDTGGIEVWS